MSDNSTQFKLTDHTSVVVRNISHDKYDFELILPNKTRKTFVWNFVTSAEFIDRKGNTDSLATEAVEKFKFILQENYQH